MNLVHQYEKVGAVPDRMEEEDATPPIRRVEFPFPYREGQKDLVVSVYRSILRKKKLFIQAPTGVGKTIASVFPRGESCRGGTCQSDLLPDCKDNYKDSGGEGFFLPLKEQGALLQGHYSDSEGKRSVFCEKTECNPDACIYAKGHF